MRNRSHRQEVKTIAEYITAETIIPPYLPYPRFLLKMDLSQTAKLLYALLLDRSTLSQKNGWTDDESRVYIVYPIAEIAEILDKSRTTIQDTLNELAAVLPLDWKLEAALLHRAELKRCTECGGQFLPKSNRGKYCPDCAGRMKRTRAAQRKRKQRGKCHALENTEPP